MGVESKPYYWITCDAHGRNGRGCDGRTPSGDYEVNAWDDLTTAIDSATESDWQITPEGWLCDGHPTCETCGQLTAAELTDADDEPICPACASKAAARAVPS